MLFVLYFMESQRERESINLKLKLADVAAMMGGRII